MPRVTAVLGGVAGRAGFVEGERAVGIQVTQHQVKPAGFDDFALEGFALAVRVLVGGQPVERVDFAGFDIDLVIQVLADEFVQALFLVLGHSHLAQVEGNHVGKTYFVGKVEFYQLVIHLENKASETEADDATAMHLDALVDDACRLEGSLAGTLLGTLHNGGGHLLIARERSQFYLIFRTIVAARNLIKLDIGL